MQGLGVRGERIHRASKGYDYMSKGVVKLDIVNVLKALSDETRLRILNILYDKELCVCDIKETLDVLQTKASRHLSYLKKARLISSRKKAQWVYYSYRHRAYHYDVSPACQG